MKSKIKLLALILALSMFIVACGKTDSNETKDEAKNTETETKDEDDSNDKTDTEESKEETQSEESKEETQAETQAENNNIAAEPGKADISKLMNSLKDASQLKPFSVKILADQKITQDGKEQDIKGESNIIFDGKTQYNDANMGKASIVSYATMEGDKASIITGMSDESGEMKFSKSSDKIEGNFGLDLGLPQAEEAVWKFEGSNGNIEKYTTTLDAKAIEEDNDEYTQYKDTKGSINVIVEYDRSINNLHSIHSKGSYTTTIVMKFDEKSDPMEYKLGQELDSKYVDFKFDNIETVVIPEEAKNAMDFDALEESYNEKLNELEKSLDELEVPETPKVPTETKAE